MRFYSVVSTGAICLRKENGRKRRSGLIIILVFAAENSIN
jgi:hypothetical protein